MDENVPQDILDRGNLRQELKRLMDDWSLQYPGIRTVEHVYLYAVHGAPDETRRRYLERAYALGRNFERPSAAAA